MAGNNNNTPQSYPTDVQMTDTTDIHAGDEFSVGSFEQTLSDDASSRFTLSSQQAPIGKKETTWVGRSKTLVFIVLAIAAISCGAATYVVMVNSERADFEAKFNDYASEVSEVSQITAKGLFGTVKSFSVSITSYAIDQQMQFPFVTIPHFEARGSEMVELSGALYFSLNPLVPSTLRTEWEDYAIKKQGWVDDSLEFSGVSSDQASEIYPQIYRRDENRNPKPEDRPTELYAPVWQLAPITRVPYLVNYNSFDFDSFPGAFDTMKQANDAVLSQVINLSSGRSDAKFTWPQSFLTAPVYNTLNKQNKTQETLVATLTAILPWHNYFTNVLPDGAKRITLVVDNTCGQTFSYQIDGPNIIYLGEGDHHDGKYDALEVAEEFARVEIDERKQGTCLYTIHLYPTDDVFDYTRRPILFTAAVVAIFLVTSSVFVIYDWFVQRRQNTVMNAAVRSTALVSSLFPAQYHERLMINDTAAASDGQSNGLLGGRNNNLGKPGASPLMPPGDDPPKGPNALTTQMSLRGDKLLNSKPIADLFPNATVLFGDLAGFTAWSSVREPAQVFTLLEQIYNSFDKIAKKLRVFKVETVGDCYVAVAGLPEPRSDHAVVMAKFARLCSVKLNESVHELEILLGPGTAELSMRYGLHSGPVTAGVLRGEKSRFQLFGDTVNTASRMESTGIKNKIHVSQDTADLLIAANKGHWVRPRKDKVMAKGKGEMQTYWVEFKGAARSSIGSGSVHGNRRSVLDDPLANAPGDDDFLEDKNARLVDWSVDLLRRKLKQIVAMRESKLNSSQDLSNLSLHNSPGTTVLEEVKEIITLPSQPAKYKQDPETIRLSDEVEHQLKDYVRAISRLYHDNPFHSFEHASWVTMSVSKLLSRVVTPDSIDYNGMKYTKKANEAAMHDYTYGITSDPITQFACVFASLVHDADHPGVPNAQLVKENADIARLYRGKSVAEQNSVDLAWDLLMEPTYEDLRECIYSSQSELNRFRQLVVNSVMATDIVDKELGQLRKNRWAKAFNYDNTNLENGKHKNSQDDVNRKATIVIEHLIQASDIAHTMQHWHVYLKWNERLFQEMYKAFQEGRSEKDPSKFWYDGEIGFFDFYIIPLAEKLKECGVFGVASDEYLTYAKANRHEWEMKGKDVIKGYLKNYHEKFENGSDDSLLIE